MTPELQPWDRIAVPHVDYVVRLVSSPTPVPCYWGRNADGDCLFIVELDGDYRDQYRKNKVSMKGVEIDLRASEPAQQRLVLTLKSDLDTDLFESFCNALVSAIQRAHDSASSLAFALAHINRWKHFLSGLKKPLLSSEQIRGLFAELTFLLDMQRHGHELKTAIQSWYGSAGAHQDFCFRNTSVEVKSLLGVDRNTVRISSEDQLESVSDWLYLRIYRMTQEDATQAARSLNDLVALIHSRIEDVIVSDVFDDKLIQYGYAPLPEYDEPHFVIRDSRSYRVEGDFPRLMRSSLPLGVTNVMYELTLESIDSYKCGDDEVYRST
jgi:hypothetical protein